MATDGTLSAVVPVEEVNLLRDEGGQMHMGMAFRPDGNSIVFSHWTPDATGLAEIGLDGTDRIELRDLADRHVAILPHLPLVDGRVLVNDDQVREGGVDLLDNGRSTRLIESGNSDNFEPVPWAVAASTTAEGFGDGVVLVVGWRADGRGLEKNDWWLVDFDGNQYRLETPENENVISATLSPGGNYVAYITFDQFSLPAVFELHVIELSAVVAGGEPVGSHVLTSEGAESLRQMDGRLSSRTMRWTYDNRMLIVLADADAPVLEIDLNPSAR